MNGLLDFLQTTMYIEISDDLVRDAIDKSTQTVNDSRDVLLLMAIAARSGKHIVSVPCLKEKAIVKALLEVIPKPYIEGLRRVESIHYILSSLKKELSNYAVLSYDRRPVNDSRAIIVNPQKYKNFEAHVETQLLTENLMDASFFEYIIHYFMRMHQLQARYCFHPLMGGGGTTADVLHKEIERGQYFCLVIVDSDRKTPDSDYGETATRVIQEMDGEKPFHCSLYIMKKVMEVENLIPITVIKDTFGQRGDFDAYMMCPSFFDLKKGLTLDALYDDNVYDYWKNRFCDAQTLFQQRNQAKTVANSRKQYREYIENHDLKKVLKCGMGSDLLDCCVNTYSCKSNIDLQKLRHRLMNISTDDLTSCQKEEWEAIGKIAFSWTCALAPNRV